MDIDDRIHIRSFSKPEVAPILKAIVIALVIHLLFFINWYSNNEIETIEIPQWINVKLKAGFETITAKPKAEVKKYELSKTRENIIKRKAKVKVEKNKITSTKIKQKPSSKATTFINADSRPYKLINPKPVYPSAARRRGMQGMVMLIIRVNHKGFVDNVDVEKTSGFRVLDQSAVDSVSRWQFIPAKKENKFVSSTVKLPIKFYLNDV